MQNTQNPARGIVYMLLSIVAFTLLDATAKGLIQRYPPSQVIWARFLGQLFLVALVLRWQIVALARTKNRFLHVVRAVTQVMTAALFFSSLGHVDLAMATALTDTAPILVTIGAALFLGERLGPRRIIAIILALCGALIILRPGSTTFSWWAVLPLLGAVSYAINALVTRRIGVSEPYWTALIWGGLGGTVAFGLTLPTVWQPVAAGDILLYLAVAVFGTLGQMFVIRSYSVAEASLVAPFSYLGIVAATIWGIIFFQEWPDFWTVVGALVIALAGLYVWHREMHVNRRARQACAEATPSPAPSHLSA